MAFSQLAIKISNTSKFTGGEEADWDTWISRFETRFADVEDKTLAGILLDVLDGTALDVCTKLGKEAYTDYKKLKLTLQSKYGKTSNPRRALAELRCTRQALGESSEAFADRVLVLTKQAYPGFNDQQVQTSALEHFMCGLSDLKLQEKLHARDDVASLDAAVDLSRSYRDKEATLMSMRNVADVDPTALTASKTVYRGGEKSDQGEDPTLLSVVEELRQGLEDIKTQVHKNERDQNRGGGRGACFECGDFAHFRRNCPRLTKKGSPSPRNGAPLHLQKTSLQCQGCGRFGHHLSQCWRTPVEAGGAGSQHPSRVAECISCGRQGHWAAECRQIPPRNYMPPRVHAPQWTEQGAAPSSSSPSAPRATGNGW